MAMRKALTLIAILFCLPAVAQEGEPPLPRQRPANLGSEAPASPGIRPAWTVLQPAEKPLVPLPRARPDEAKTPAAPADGTPAAASEADAVTPGGPPAEPRIYQVACPAVLQGKVEAKALPPISDQAGGGRQCGVQSPLELTGVLANGRMVPVSAGVTTDCGVASAMPDWLQAVDSYLVAREKTRLAEVVVGTSYMCRNVNNATTGNLSFHAFADALDIVGFKLEDGRTVTIEGGWGDALSSEGRLLRFAHGAACTNFTTVLGPEADAQHADNLHVDLGCHGKTCTARLCE